MLSSSSDHILTRKFNFLIGLIKMTYLDMQDNCGGKWERRRNQSFIDLRKRKDFKVLSLYIEENVLVTIAGVEMGTVKRDKASRLLIQDADLRQRAAHM